MFTIRKDHVDALRPSLRASTADRVVRALRGAGHDVARDEATGEVVLRGGRGGLSRASFRDDGAPMALETPSGARWRFLCGDDGVLRGIESPRGERLEVERDVDGRVTALRRPGLLEYRLAWTSGMLAAVEHPDGTASRFTYGGDGALESATDRTGATTRYSTLGVTSALRIDPLGRELRVETDRAGELRAITFPDGSMQRVEAHRASTSLRVTRRSGEVVAQHYDEAGRLREIRWPDGRATTFSYDESGRVASVDNEAASLHIGWDDRGNAVAEETAAGEVRTRYDIDGRVTAVVTPSGEMVEYAYDADGNLSMIRDWQGREILIRCAPSGAWDRVEFPGGVTEARTYGPTGRAWRSTVTDREGRVRSELAYEYDLCDRLTARIERWGDADDERVSRQLSFDAEGRILGEVDAATGAELHRYAYDLKGNLVCDDGVPVLVGAMDEPLERGGRAVAWDQDGQARVVPYEHGATTCRFVADGTLREVEQGGRVWRYAYDGLGRRVSKTDGQVGWRYGWSEDRLLWEEHRPHPDAPWERRAYLYAPDVVAPLAFREGGRTCWLQHDTRGAVVRAFDEEGRVVWAALYDSFGRADVRVAEVRQPWRLQGQYEDEETGLHYNLARYYCPRHKTYLSLDPRWSEQGATHYSYCQNDPWNRADPLGTIGPLVVVGVLAASAVVGAIVGAVMTPAHGNAWMGALTGAITGVCTAAGGLIGNVPGAIIGGAVGAFLARLVEDKLTKGEVCLPCALQDAAMSVAFDLLLAGLGKVFSKPLKRFLRPLMEKLDDLTRRWWRRVVGAGDGVERKALPAPEVPAAPPKKSAAELVGDLPGHGHERHGSGVTMQQLEDRVRTGVLPDGTKKRPPPTATSFNSDAAELDAVRRATAIAENLDAAGKVNHAITVDENGFAKLPREEIVVTGHPGGYGEGVTVVTGPNNKPLPGRPTQPTGPLPNATVIMERGVDGAWRPVTQYPSNDMIQLPR